MSYAADGGGGGQQGQFALGPQCNRGGVAGPAGPAKAGVIGVSDSPCQ